MTGDSSEHPSVKPLGADDADLQPGQTVGEYVVDKKIGEGGFGTVFKATHPLIGKLVAVKVLNRQFSAQAEMVSRFISEARAVNQIRHRNIIDIFAFGQLDDGRHYYIMEFLDGVPLDEHLDQRGRLTLPEAIPILRSVAKALDAAHAKGIAHRDLKPENVFLIHDDDGGLFPKLLDFGIAKLLSSESPTKHKTRTGAPIGTPSYMSPEQCRGREVDHRTDIYAFGIVTYRMLTGVLPFEGDDYMEILMAQIQEEAAPPSTYVADLPTSVDAGVAWMLRKDPGERPPNLVTAVRALEDAAEAAGIAVPAGPAPSGVYAASTGSVLSQHTPSRVTPMPRADSHLGSAATIGADAFHTQAGAAPPKRGLILGAALVGAIAVGGLVYFLLAGGKNGGKQEPVAALPVIEQPTPAPQPEPVPEPVPEPIPEPEYVKLTIKGAPDGTEVYLAGNLLGVVPEVQLPRGDETLLLTFQLDGYKPTTKKVRPVGDKSLEVSLAKKRGRTKPKPTGRNGRDERNTLEDPFR